MSRSRTLWNIVAITTALGVIGLLALVYKAVEFWNEPTGPPCQAVSGGVTYEFDLEQAENATTIAAIGKKLGMPNRAVTVALATAMQESDLRNLNYGHADSIGLFQQRPSQGWGTRSQIMSPRYSATAFYEKLDEISGWQSMAVTEAAQAVQRRAFPNAYAKWEDRARAIARAATGEVAAGMTCQSSHAKAAVDNDLTSEMKTEIGANVLDLNVSDARGWTAASWLIGHSKEHGITSVTFAGKKWDAESGKWSSSSSSDRIVRVNE